MVVGDAWTQNSVDKTLGHGWHNVPPDGENEDKMIRLLQALRVVNDHWVGWHMIDECFEVFAGHCRVKAIIVQMH